MSRKCNLIMGPSGGHTELRQNTLKEAARKEKKDGCLLESKSCGNQAAMK